MISAFDNDKDRKTIIANQQLDDSKKRLKKLNNDIEKLKKSIQESSGVNPGDNNLVNDVDNVTNNEVTEEDINSVNLTEYKADLEQALEEEIKRKESIIKSIQQYQAAKTSEPIELNQELKTVELSIESKKKDIEKITKVNILSIFLLKILVIY